MKSQSFEYYVKRAEKLDELETYLSKIKDHLSLEARGFYVVDDLDQIIIDMINFYYEETIDESNDTNNCR